MITATTYCRKTPSKKNAICVMCIKHDVFPLKDMLEPQV